MQAIPMIFGSLFGGTAAVGATAAAAGTLSTITTGLQIAGTVAGLASATAMSSYQAKVAENNSIIALENAGKAATAAQEESQQRGLAAQFEMGDLLANQSASGLNLGSGSYALVRKSQAELAARDTRIIMDEGNQRVENFKQQSADFRSDGAQARSAKRYAFLEAGLGIGTSLVSGATRVNKIKAGRYT